MTDRRVTDVRRYLLANTAFHEYQVDLAGNATLSQLHRRLSVFALQERALIVLGESAAGDSDAEHTARSWRLTCAVTSRRLARRSRRTS